MEETRSYFDEMALGWDTSERIERARLAADCLRAGMPESARGRALDLGCGTGLLSFFLRDVFEEILLLDSSSGMIAELERKIGQDDEARRVAGAVPGARMSTRLGVPESALEGLGPFDAAYAMLSLHHMPDTGGVMNALASALRPHGELRILDLDAEDGSFHGAESGFAGHNGFEREALGELAVAAGFEKVSFQTFWTEVRREGDAVREYPMFLMRARRLSGL
jgi:SAM-dependent methyltransferase